MSYDDYKMGMISQNVIKQIEGQVDIVEFISHYVTFERRGDRYFACCPFHTERTPSFSVNPVRKIYYCFGCKKNGNLFQFVMDMENLSFIDSIRYLANRLGISIEEEGSSNSDNFQQKSALLLLYQRITKTFEHCLWNTKEGEKGLQYLIGRGLSEKTVKYYCLGYTPADRFFLYSFLVNHGFSKEILEKSGLFLLRYPTISLFCNRIVFPIMQATGEVVGFSGRILVIDDDKKTPKYLNTSETIIYNKGRHLYGFFQAKSSFKEEGFMLCEGAMDVCAMFEMGYTRAVASLGTGFTEEQAKLLKRYTDKGCIIFDNDSAGEKAKKAAILLCTKQNLRVSVFEHCEEKDPGEILEKKNLKGLQKSLDNVKIPVDFLVDVARRVFPDTNLGGAFDICQAVFPFVAVVSSPVLQDGVLRQLALRVDLKEGVVFDEFKRFSKKSSNFCSAFELNEVLDSGKQNTSTTENVQFRGTIYELLGIFLKNPSMYHDVSERLKTSWFDTHESRMVVSYLKGNFSIDFSQWIAEQAVFNDNIKQYLLKEFCESTGLFERDSELVNTIIGLLELKSLEEKRLKLIELIREVEGRNGDVHSVADLVGDYVLVVRELQELRAGL